MKRLLLAVLLIVLVAAGWLIVRFLERGGQFVELVEKPLAACQAVASPAGPEDLQIDQETGWVFVSAVDRRAAAAGQSVRGSISAFRLDRAGDAMRDLTGVDGSSGAPQTFVPHGISLYHGVGQKTLAVINHVGPTESHVELFRLSYDSDAAPRLQHLWSVESEHFRSPNDIVLVGPDSYYVANDHWYPDGLMNGIETFAMLDLATVVYGEGKHTRIAAEGLSFGNGIAATEDGETVFVVDTIDAQLRIYDRNPDTGDLRLRPGKEGLMGLFRGPDNIDRATDGSLWIAGHPKMLKFLGHAADPEKFSPTQVVRLSVSETGRPGPMETVYINDGSQLSGGSVAAAHDGQVVIGQVLDEAVLVCPLPDALR